MERDMAGTGCFPFSAGVALLLVHLAESLRNIKKHDMLFTCPGCELDLVVFPAILDQEGLAVGLAAGVYFFQVDVFVVDRLFVIGRLDDGRLFP